MVTSSIVTPRPGDAVDGRPLAFTIRHRHGGDETGQSAPKGLNAKVSHHPPPGHTFHPTRNACFTACWAASSKLSYRRHMRSCALLRRSPPSLVPLPGAVVHYPLLGPGLGRLSPYLALSYRRGVRLQLPGFARAIARRD